MAYSICFLLYCIYFRCRGLCREVGGFSRGFRGKFGPANCAGFWILALNRRGKAFMNRPSKLSPNFFDNIFFTFLLHNHF